MTRFLEPISDDELKAELWDRIGRALNNVDNELSNKRIETMKYYRGENYGNEKDGYSKAKTRQVFEAVEWTMPRLMRAFFSGHTPVEFDPVGPEDEQGAEQDTAVVYSIIRRNEYYNALETWFRDALINPNGYIKVWWEEDYDYSPPTEYNGLTFAQVGLLETNPNVYIEGAEVDEANLFRVVVRYMDRRGKICFAPVPPEEVLVDNDITSIDLDTARLVVHHRQVERSELADMGYDPDLIATVPRSNRLRYSTEREARRITEDEQDYLRNNGANEEVDFYECYFHVDQDGDGFTEFRKICMAGTTGNTVFFENEETDFQPLIALSTVCQPHRHVGESMAQQAQENQLIQSTLTRQMLDNLYRTNRPRTWAGRGVDVDKLMTYVPHGAVPMEDVKQIATEVTQPVVQSVMPAFDYFERRFEATTGVNRQAQGLDAKTLSDAPMSSYLDAKSDSTSRIELIIRSWAETGVKKLFCKVHHLMRKYQDIATTVRVNGQWTDVDPSSWRNRADATIKVGLGTGTPEERISAGLSILELQKQALPHGMTTPTMMYKTLNDICMALGRPGADGYFINPNTPEGAQRLAQIQQERKQAEEQQKAFAVQGLQLDARDKFAKRMIDSGELQRKIQKDAMDHLEKMTDLELTHDENVPGSAV